MSIPQGRCWLWRWQVRILWVCLSFPHFQSYLSDLQWQLRALLPVSECANNFPPLPKIMKMKPCFYQNIEEEIPAQHQLLVRRVYQLWMSKCFAFTVLGSLSLSCMERYGFSLLCFLPSCLLCSVFCHAVLERHFLHCLVGWRWQCQQLWFLAPLAHSLHSLQLRLLVPATLQGFQVCLNCIIYRRLCSAVHSLCCSS